MSKRVLFIMFLLSGWLSLSAQGSDDYRLKALRFLCSNKNELLKISKPFWGDFSPVFFLDIRQNENDVFYIDSVVFNPDTEFVKDFMKALDKENVIEGKPINFTYLSAEGVNVFANFCDCIYLDPVIVMDMDSIPNTDNSSLCKREFGLSISRVLSCGDYQYVVLRISSFFLARVDKMQFCIMEFNNDGTILRCGVGNVLTVD